MNAKTEKTDHLDYGPMGNYDDTRKPECPKCNRKTFVTATGRNHLWRWSCTCCVVDIEPFVSPAASKEGE